MESFLLVPLACAGNDLGALLLASSPPAYVDKYGTMLATDLGLALSQTLYTLACIGQMRAGQQILHDIMPEKVSSVRVLTLARPNRLATGSELGPLTL
jgi:hypothetical protein